ncbi:MAG: helix-turn-helix transcriptional regulator [Gemmatimonadetes bacterium]|nr:helix-turn-helix transcriptional regulator [Gemmatimonadota bacterium]
MPVVGANSSGVPQGGAVFQSQAHRFRIGLLVALKDRIVVLPAAQRAQVFETDTLQLRRKGYSTINALYHGKTERVEFATLEALCEVLGCEVGDLIQYVPEKKRGRPG